MNKKLYFLTRSYDGFQKGGGPRARRFQVEYLQSIGFDVIVILPTFTSNKIIKQENIIQIPASINDRFAYRMVTLGLKYDYLDKWSENSFNYLKNIIAENDIVFATTGGDFAAIHLGYKLKKYFSIKLVISYHDPVDYLESKNRIIKCLKIKNRKKKELDIIKISDLIITSSLDQKRNIQKRLPNINKKKLFDINFGYFEKSIQKNQTPFNSDKVVFGYGGSLGSAQRFEKVLKLFKTLKKHELWVFGKYPEEKKYKGVINIKFHNWVSQKEYNDIFLQKINVGIVSLGNSKFSVCVPSKIYDYINLELPILGFLYDGQAKDIINQNKFGYAVSPDSSFDVFNNIIKSFEIFENIKVFKENIREQKKSWYFNLLMDKVKIKLHNL